ncbi:YdcH family protein [Acinetobacter rudis]|uniref:YdcH family protein n=1 Tax=Acinetobacter rudis TaxID=632955 RepID=A0AAW8J6S0_9GAMM|nr:YdcH family protein [Acinetobacter rudis]MDQ8935273.1 YdcH family protein [Acinetobacter rudis]MDQ9017532.1 YdcH family protein [Acinetobacter rudis]
MNIKLMNKKLKHMFPEYSELMAILKQNDPHFAKMLEAHDELDREIARLELNPVHVINHNLEALKRQKLKYKDRLYALLKKAAHCSNSSLTHSSNNE